MLLPLLLVQQQPQQSTQLAVLQAIDAGIRLIDTAVMYGNDEQVAKIIKGTRARAGTKLRRAATIETDLARSIELFGADLERVLLHVRRRRRLQRRRRK